MNDKIKTVLEKISKNDELKAQLKANPPKSEEDLVALAAKVGIELTVDEIKAANKELSDEKLDKVSGGGCGWATVVVCVAGFLLAGWGDGGSCPLL